MNIDSAELIGKKEGKEQRIDLLKDNSIFLLSIERKHFDNHFKLEIVGKRKEYAVWLLIEELKKHDERLETHTEKLVEHTQQIKTLFRERRNQLYRTFSIT